MRSHLKQDLLPLALLALAALVFFWPVTLNLGWIPSGGGDLASFLWPTYSYAAQSLHAGRVPLWNPALYAGAPFAADNQTGVFYPVNLLAFLLAPDFPYAAIEWLVVFHVWLAGAGMYGLMRVLLPGGEQTYARPAALVAALAYMFSDVFVTHVGNLNIIAVSAWLPAALAALHLGLSRESAGWSAGAGVILGVAALAGHAQMTLILAGALGLYALWRLAVELRPAPEARAALGKRLMRLAAHTLLAFAVAFGVSALAVIPAVEMTQYTGRARLDYAAAAEYSLPWPGLAGLFSPLVFGRGAERFWGPWDRVELGYAGLLPLLLAGLALIRDRRGSPVFFLLLGGFGLLAALGAQTPFHRLLYLTVPGFAQLRVPARFVLLTDLALAALAGYGLCALAAIPRRRAWAALLLLAVVGAAAILLGYRAAEAAAGISRPEALTLVLAAAAGLLLAGAAVIWLSARSARAAAWLAVIVAAIDLLGHGAWVEVDRADPTLGFRHAAAANFLRGQPGPTRIDNASAAWQPDAAARWGLEDIGGLHNPLALAAYQTYLGAVGSRGTPLYNFLNAQFVIADKGRPPGDSSFIPVFDEDPSVDIYLNTQARPRVSLAHAARRVPDGEAAFAAIHAPGFDPATTVVVEGAAAPQPQAPPQDGESNLFYLDYAPEAFALIAVTPAPAYVVFSEVWYPGWRAWIDGAEAPIYRVNFAFRGVYLAEPGEHLIAMRFEPATWTMGLGLTGLTVFGLCLWAAWRLRPERRRSA